MINFCELKEELKRGIFKRLEKIDPIEHPTDWAWITYALSLDGKGNNPLFKKVFNDLEKWTQSKDSGKQERHLAPLSIYIYLVEDKEQKKEIISKVTSILDRVLTKEISKFSPLNDPEQVFCISIISKELTNKHRKSLEEAISKKLEGRLLRQVLYIASMIELGNVNIEWPQLRQNDSPEDLIALIWLHEKYKKYHTKDVASLWESFKNLKPIINFNTLEEGEGLINISNRSISMLYESILLEIHGCDPNTLFDNYPLHPRIRQISKDYFKRGSYAVAVEQAAKALNKFIQEKTGIRNKSETELIQATIKNIRDPKIIFNEFLNEDSGKNEQAGLASIAEGIFKAFRNPKGHEPQDHPIVQVDAYDALDQLIIISYIMKRIEKAQIKKLSNV